MEMRKAGVIVICAAILLSAAFFYMMSGDKGFESFRNNADSSSYQINYSADFNESFVGSQYNYSSFELYSNNERYKNVIRYERNGTKYRNVSFIAGNDSLVCGSLHNPGIRPENCSIGESATKFFYDLIDAAPDYRAEINGTGNVSGYECSRFSFTTRKKFVPNGEDLQYSPKVDMCLDNEEGYVASIDITGYINQSNGTERISVASISAEDVNRDYSGDAAPDFRLLTNTYCSSSDTSLEVLALEDIGSITVEISNRNETFNISPYQRSDIYIPRNLLDSGSNDIKVYADGITRELSCNYSPE